MTFDCGGAVHSQLKFWLAPLEANNYSAQMVSLELRVDGKLQGTYSGDGGGWRQVQIPSKDATPRKHIYQFSARSEVATQSIFLLDSFECLAE